MPATCTRQLLLPNDAHAPSAARSYVTRVLSAAGMEKICEAACIVASELVTNAVVHVASSVIAIECEAALDVAIIAVWDESSDVPEIRLGDITAEGGRGLFLVASLSDRWGWYESCGGKTVYAEVSRP